MSTYSLPLLAVASCITIATLSANAQTKMPSLGLVLDLDAERGVEVQEKNRVTRWTNQAPAAIAKSFVQRDEGRKVAGNGRPTRKQSVDQLNGKATLVFRQQELVCMHEDAFDGLTTGKGNTWISVMCVHQQRLGLKDVNSFFGNLRNGARYEGLWGCLDDDNTLWYGGRNGRTFGRFDANNPKISGPKLTAKRYYLVAGRMAAGTGRVLCELFVNSPTAVAQKHFPVDPKANPSRMTIGQERDAIQHPGKESFDGEIARFLIWERPLSDTELATVMTQLTKYYGLKAD